MHYIKGKIIKRSSTTSHGKFESADIIACRLLMSIGMNDRKFHHFHL